MSRTDDTTQPSFFERAIDARTDEARSQLLSDIRASSPEDQSLNQFADQFEAAAILADAEGFREQLQCINPTPALMASLLEVAYQHPRRFFDWREVADRPVNWRHVAACLFVATSLLTYVLWTPSRPKMAALDSKVAQHLSDLAINSEADLVWPAQHSDPTEMLTTWQGCHLPFTPDILQPAEPVHFVNGGAVSFDGNPALFTQWTNDHSRYVLFQFDRKTMNLPENFMQETVRLGKSNTRVNIWPGGDGTSGWALISIDAPPSGNIFTDMQSLSTDAGPNNG